MREENWIEFRDIVKCFPGVTALSRVSFAIQKGEIHCLCGENGAGKSTLIHLCGGVYQPDSGQIKMCGHEVKIDSPAKSEKLKIAIVYQEIPLCKNMSIAANIFLGAKPKTQKGFLDWNHMNAETQKLLDLFDLKLEPGTLVENLTIAEQSLIQIAKAIHGAPDFLILDEPTASLANKEKDKLFAVLNKIRHDRELTILYVSHRLEEVFEIADRITVLRDGSFVETVLKSAVDANKIIQMMVGREIKENIYVENKKIGEILLEVKNISRCDVIKDSSFTLRKGEILGFAGFQGAGRTELARAIFGLDKRDGGEILIDGVKVDVKDSRDAIRHGIGMIPENRRDEGIIPQMSVIKNLIMVSLKETSRYGYFHQDTIKRLAQRFIAKLKIKISSPEQNIENLSGGNQQKTIIARWLAKETKILICDEPTRGIDVGAKADVYLILSDLARNGAGIIMISSDLPELLHICDRIIVMHEGEIVGELTHHEASEEKIMLLAAGL